MQRIALLAVLLLGACATAAPPPRPSTPADLFFAQLKTLCGRSYEGRVVADAPTPSPDFAGKRLVMHVRDCSEDEVRIPFRVGDDRSRTWVVTRTPTGLRLKHDHRHADGTPDRLTNYGGETLGPGFAARQEFPVDAETNALFIRENIPASVENVWAFSMLGNTFAYELSRPQRFFRVEFDLSRPLTSPE